VKTRILAARWHAGWQAAFSDVLMLKLQQGFGHETQDGMYHLGNAVGGNIQGKPILATLKPTSAEIIAATDAYGAARDMVGPGRKEALLATRTELAGLLTEVAMNAPQIAGITDMDLAQIGLRVLQKPGPKTTEPPAKCENFQTRYGQEPGTVLGACAPAKPMVRLYEGQWTLDPTGNTWSAILTFPNSRAFAWSWNGVRIPGSGCGRETSPGPVPGAIRLRSWWSDRLAGSQTQERRGRDLPALSFSWRATAGRNAAISGPRLPASASWASTTQN
jgi:hypothetical protein